MSAAKQGVPEGGDNGGSGGTVSCTPKLLKVVVTWCDENCDKWEQEVNLEECDGFIWRDRPHGKAPGGGNDPTKPRLPKSGTKQPRGRCSGDEAGVIAPTSGAPRASSYCWFDGRRWVCPDGL